MADAFSNVFGASRGSASHSERLTTQISAGKIAFSEQRFAKAAGKTEKGLGTDLFLVDRNDYSDHLNQAFANFANLCISASSDWNCVTVPEGISLSVQSVENDDLTEDENGNIAMDKLNSYVVFITLDEMPTLRLASKRQEVEIPEYEDSNLRFAHPNIKHVVEIANSMLTDLRYLARMQSS